MPQKKNRAAGRLARQEALIQRIATAVWAAQPKIDCRTLFDGMLQESHLRASSQPLPAAEALLEYRQARLA